MQRYFGSKVQSIREVIIKPVIGGRPLGALSSASGEVIRECMREYHQRKGRKAKRCKNDLGYLHDYEPNENELDLVHYLHFKTPIFILRIFSVGPIT